MRWLNPLLLFPLLALAMAMPASKQFSLSTQLAASKCFLACHGQVVNTISLSGKRVNFISAITKNCQMPNWAFLVGSCLPAMCTSGPDVAYAVEYGESFCRRAGVPDVQFTLPAWFLQSPGGEYYNSTLVSGAATTTPAAVGVVAAAVLAALAF